MLTAPMNPAASSMEITSNADPYLKPAFSLRNRVMRMLWNVVQATLFRFSPRPLHAWRAWLLRCFGARLGPGCHIYPRARIWAPWNLVCERVVCIGDEAIVYNPGRLYLGSHVIVSQQAYLCGATHDYRDPAFPMIWAPITIGRYAWICARATVQSGVTVGEGAVLGLGSVTARNLEPWTVYAGVPAQKIKTRPRTDDSRNENRAHPVEREQ
jgi:putative colanic acid biosynthesis acetyltransferase WcaF